MLLARFHRPSEFITRKQLNRDCTERFAIVQVEFMSDPRGRVLAGASIACSGKSAVARRTWQVIPLSLTELWRDIGSIPVPPLYEWRNPPNIASVRVPTVHSHGERWFAQMRTVIRNTT
jgi:hypothetical protein